MKYIFLTVALVLTLSAFSVAQSSDYNKGEFYIGYSNGQVDTGNNFSNSGNAVQRFFNNRTNFNGFEVAGVYNISRYIGLKADLSGTYHRSGSFSFPVTTGATTQTVSGNITSRFTTYSAACRSRTMRAAGGSSRLLTRSWVSVMPGAMSRT